MVLFEHSYSPRDKGFTLLASYFPSLFADLFRFVRAFLIAADIRALNSASSFGATASAIAAFADFFFGAFVLALAALTFAHRALVAAMIRCRPSSLMVRFFGAEIAGATTELAACAAFRLAQFSFIRSEWDFWAGVLFAGFPKTHSGTLLSSPPRASIAA